MAFYRIFSTLVLLVFLAGVSTAEVYADPTGNKSIRFSPPLVGQPLIARSFLMPNHHYGPGHRGVDLIGHIQAAVLAPATGVVAFAGEVAGRGVISIDHPHGLRSTYEPVEPQVKVGTVVAVGDIIGYLVAGHLGCDAVACLHWGVRQGNNYLDPMSFLIKLGQVRLLPLKKGDMPGGKRISPFL